MLAGSYSFCALAWSTLRQTDGHHEGASNPFAAYIGDNEAYVFFVDFDDIIIIPSDIEGGVVKAGYVDGGQPRKGLG